jgi:hypothetical protein
VTNSTNFEYNKLQLKTVVILIPKNHTNLVSFLTPILGLYGIDIRKFVSEVQQKISFLNLDLIVPVEVLITKIKTYSLNFKTPYILNLVKTDFINSLNILGFFKIFLIKSVLNNFFSLTKTQSKIRFYLNIRSFFYKLITINSLEIIENTKILFFNNFFKFNKFKFFRYMLFFKFGFFYYFSNFSEYKLNSLKFLLDRFDLRLIRVQSYFKKLFLNFSFRNNFYFIGSPNFSNLVNFSKNFFLLGSSTFTPVYIKIFSNLVNFSKNFFLLGFEKNFKNIKLSIIKTLVFLNYNPLKFFCQQLYKIFKCLHIIN